MDDLACTFPPGLWHLTMEVNGRPFISDPAPYGELFGWRFRHALTLDAKAELIPAWDGHDITENR